MTGKSVVALALLAICSTSQAQNYLSIGAGLSRYSICHGESTCDQNGKAFKLMLGQKVTESTFTEIGLMDFGRASVASSIQSVTLSGAGVGIGLAFRERYTPNWDLTARAGVMSMQARASVVTAGLFFLGNQRTMQFYGGLATGYRIHPSISIDLGVDVSRVKFNRSGVTVSSPVTALTIGTTLDF